jgi:hypothetical protein
MIDSYFSKKDQLEQQLVNSISISKFSFLKIKQNTKQKGFKSQKEKNIKSSMRW